MNSHAGGRRPDTDASSHAARVLIDQPDTSLRPIPNALQSETREAGTK